MLQKHRLRLADGMKVRVFGYLDYYAPTGRVGLKMTGIDPKYTLGDIAQSRDEVVRRLVAEGLLDANRSSSVVTRAAADRRGHQRRHRGLARLPPRTRIERARIPAVGRRRAGAGRVRRRPWSPPRIGTLARLGHLDAIVVIRGGGAKNELAVFDAEVIARTIAAQPGAGAHRARSRGRPQRRRRGGPHRA